LSSPQRGEEIRGGRQKAKRLGIFAPVWPEGIETKRRRC